MSSSSWNKKIEGPYCEWEILDQGRVAFEQAGVLADNPYSAKRTPSEERKYELWAEGKRRAIRAKYGVEWGCF